ncbi:MAG: tRNA pseudouridine(55) synthase TruB [Desulfococcaceae bacterium]
MGRDPDGLLLLDKPAGISSAAALNRVKRLTGARKAGHTGTLDPFATGLLVCCLGRATRLSRFFLEGDKQYAATLRLGVETDTQDRTGTVTAERPVPPLTPDEIEAAFAPFRGTFSQEPPAYSALKHEGVPLYRLARKGKPVQKPPRRVAVRELAVKEIRPPEIDFTVTCSAGTYIRTLAVDVGRRLGPGAHLSALRRTASGGLTLDRAVALEGLAELTEAGRLSSAMIHMAEALPLPVFRADEALARRILHGNPLTAADLPGATADEGGHLQVLAPDGRMLAVLRREMDQKYAYDCVLAAPGTRNDN